MKSQAQVRKDDARLRTANKRTAIVLATIAAIFFLGIVTAKFTGDARTGMTLLGVAVLVFLVFAIGRSLRK